jgi:hypothetical protein
MCVGAARLGICDVATVAGAVRTFRLQSGVGALCGAMMYKTTSSVYSHEDLMSSSLAMAMAG